jgi:hypothetical protein
MLPNNLHLRFGNKVPDGAVNLAYVPVQGVSPHSNVLIASHIAKMDANNAEYYTDAITTAATVTGLTLTCTSTGAGITSIATSGSQRGVYISPLKVVVPEETPTDSWLVRLQDGVIQHEIVYDPAVSGGYDSWLHKIGYTGVKHLKAFYTLQESTLCKRDTYDPNFPQERMQARAYKEKVYVTGINSLQTIRPSIYAIEALYINSRTIQPNAIYYITSDTSSVLRGGMATSTGAEAVVNVATGEISLIGTQVSVSDEITATYTYTTSTLSYRGYFETVTVSGTAKQVFRDLNLNPEYGQTYDNGKATTDLTQQCTSIYILPSAVYDMELAAASGIIALYRAVDYGEYSLVRWTSQPIQTHYEVAGVLPWELKPTTAITLNIAPTGATIEVGHSIDFYCTVEGSIQPVVKVAMAADGTGELSAQTLKGTTNKWTYTAPNISSPAGSPYNMNVTWERIEKSLIQQVVPITVTSTISVVLTRSGASSAINRFSTSVVTPSLTGEGSDIDLIWAVYTGSTQATTYGSVYPEDPLIPGSPMPSGMLAHYGFSTFVLNGVDCLRGPAYIFMPDVNGIPIKKSLSMIYTPPTSPDGGTTKWGYTATLRAYAHVDLNKYGQITDEITSGVQVVVQPARAAVKTSTTKALEVTVIGIDSATQDSGLVTWSANAVNTTGGVIATAVPTFVSGPVVNGHTATSIYNYAVPATSGYYTLAASSVLDPTAIFTVHLSGFVDQAIGITSVSGTSISQATLPDVYGLEPGHELQLTATMFGVSASASANFQLYTDEALTAAVTSTAHGTIYATGNPSSGVYTCNIRMPVDFMAIRRASLYVKTTCSENTAMTDSLNLFGYTNISWSGPATGYYDCAVPYLYVLSLNNLGSSVSGALALNGTGLTMATSAWLNGPQAIQIGSPVTTTALGSFGHSTLTRIPLKIITPFSSAGTGSYNVTVSVTGIASGTTWNNGRVLTANRLTKTLLPTIVNWKVAQTSLTGFVASDNFGGYILTPGNALTIGAAISVSNKLLTSYYTGSNVNFTAVSGIAWTLANGEHAATGTITALNSGAVYTPPYLYELDFKQTQGDGWYKKLVTNIIAKPAAIAPAYQTSTIWPIRIDSTVRSITVEPADEASRTLLGEGLRPGESVTLVATVNHEGTFLTDTNTLWTTGGLNGVITNLDTSLYVTGVPTGRVVYTVPSGFSSTLQVTDVLEVASSYDTDITNTFEININYSLTPPQLTPNLNIRLGKYGEAIYDKYRFSDT